MRPLSSVAFLLVLAVSGAEAQETPNFVQGIATSVKRAAEFSFPGAKGSEPGKAVSSQSRVEQPKASESPRKPQSKQAVPRKQPSTPQPAVARPAQARAKPAPTARPAFSQQDQIAASVPGFAGIRLWGDQGADYLKALPAAPGPWLLISTGGADGAYGVGVLSGWSQTGQRPNFSVVTGVSTGALIAPFAFLGSKYDASLQNDYTTITSADIFEVAGKPEAPLDTWPLKDTISKRVTAKLLDEIATEHEGGRRLFIATSNLDAERPIVWNMGAVAAYRNERALKLFRDIVLASASIPGVFPPVYIDVEANGKRFNEMHADGGANGPFFVAPEELLSRHTSHTLPASELFIIVNSKLSPDFEVIERDQISILGRSISVILKSSARVTLASVYEFAQRQGIGFNASWVDSNFNMQAKTNFDQTYMKALFELGVAHGKSGIAFRKTPFGHPERAEEAGGSATGSVPELRR